MARQWAHFDRQQSKSPCTRVCCVSCFFGGSTSSLWSSERKTEYSHVWLFSVPNDAICCRLQTPTAKSCPPGRDTLVEVVAKKLELENVLWRARARPRCGVVCRAASFGRWGLKSSISTALRIFDQNQFFSPQWRAHYLRLPNVRSTILGQTRDIWF